MKNSTFEITDKDVHAEFKAAADWIIREAYKILNELPKPKRQTAELADIEAEFADFIKLQQIGLNTPEVQSEIVNYHYRKRQLKLVSQKRKLLENKIRMATYYASKYPHQKFLDEEELQRICRQYGLVVGKPENFKGRIPERNRKELLSFKLDPQDRVPVKEQRLIIVATPDLFHKTVIEPKFGLKKDPVILKEVVAGYLVITMWGPEAQIKAFNKKSK